MNIFITSKYSYLGDKIYISLKLSCDLLLIASDPGLENV